MSQVNQKANRPQHDTSICLKQHENDRLIQFIESKDGVTPYNQNIEGNMPSLSNMIGVTNRTLLTAHSIILNLDKTGGDGGVFQHQHSNSSPSSGSDMTFNSFTDVGKFGSMGKSAGKDTRKNKSQISNPTGFKVIQHVGLSSTTNNFEINLPHDANSNMMREILGQLNVPIKKKTISFAHDYLKSHGGMEKVEKELTNKSRNPSQQRSPPPPPPANPPSPIPTVPQPPPQRQQQQIEFTNRSGNPTQPRPPPPPQTNPPSSIPLVPLTLPPSPASPPRPLASTSGSNISVQTPPPALTLMEQLKRELERMLPNLPKDNSDDDSGDESDSEWK